VKLSDALQFSRVRKAIILVNMAENEEMGVPALDNVPFTATDYGVEAQIFISPMVTHTVSSAWSSMDPASRRHFLSSENWEPVDPKPAMLIIAEAASDWSIHEQDVQELPADEEGYYA